MEQTLSSTSWTSVILSRAVPTEQQSQQTLTGWTVCRRRLAQLQHTQALQQQHQRSRWSTEQTSSFTSRTSGTLLTPLSWMP